jgi:hypothetical protein
VEHQLEEQIQVQRREVYVGYLRAAAQACLAWQTGDDDAKINDAVVEVWNQQGQVLLSASAENSDLQEAVDRFTDAITSGEACRENPDFLALRNTFVEAAQPDLE